MTTDCLSCTSVSTGGFTFIVLNFYSSCQLKMQILKGDSILSHRHISDIAQGYS